jgi:hypothetical protein
MGIRSSFRGLWKGFLDYDQFFESMMLTIRSGFTRAWYEGAAKCGIKPNELSPEERLQMEANINNQFQYIDGVAAAIEAGSQANKGKLTPLLRRGDIWVNGYRATVMRAQALACGDRKGEWQLGDAEHCDSCVKLHGKVKRLSYWNDRGILPAIPGAPYLDCSGYNCQCTLVITDKPMSRGPLPRLP